MDKPIEQLKKLNHLELILLIALFVFALAPGIITIWVYSPEVIISISTAKLILLGFAITFPTVTINFVFISIYRQITNTKSSNLGFEYFFEFANALIISATSYLVVDLISLLMSLSLLSTVLSVLGVNAIILFLAIKVIKFVV